MKQSTVRVGTYFRAHLADLKPYVGVETVESLAARLGVRPDRVSKLDANENPYGPSPLVYDALASLSDLHRYPDPLSWELRARIAEYASVPISRVLVGAGADELIELLVRVFVDPGDTVVDSTPTFSMYSAFTLQNGGRVVDVPRDGRWELDVASILRAVRSGLKLIFICSPNNPTGNLVAQADLVPLLETGIPVVLDEAYYEFGDRSFAALLPQYPNLIVLRTFSKLAGLAGLRIGYMIADEEVVTEALKIKQPYNNTVASQAAALASLDDLPRLQENVRLIVQERDRMSRLLMDQGTLVPYPSDANFLLCQVRGNARAVHSELAARGVFVRHFEKPRLQGCLRVSVGTPDDTDRLLGALEALNPLGQR